MKEYLILGTDRQDAEKQRDLWLSRNPTIKVVKIHRVKREPPTWLARIAVSNVPRVSIMVEYVDSDDSAKSNEFSRPARQTEEDYCEKNTDDNSQCSDENFRSGEPSVNVKEVP